METEVKNVADQIFGNYSFQSGQHVAARITFTIVMPKVNDAALVAYGRLHVPGEAFMTDPQVIAHLAAMVLAGLGDGLVENPDWLK